MFLAASLTTAAAETWPARPVKVIVGFAAGGPTDLFARLIAQKLSEQTGKNFYIENLSGAGGNIGTARAAQSSPDGYTILVTGLPLQSRCRGDAGRIDDESVSAGTDG